MDESARLIIMEGVRPLNQLKGNSRRVTNQRSSVSSRGIVASPELCPGGDAWVTGARERLATAIRDGRHGWATGIRRMV